MLKRIKDVLEIVFPESGIEILWRVGKIIIIHISYALIRLRSQFYAIQLSDAVQVIPFTEKVQLTNQINLERIEKYSSLLNFIHVLIDH